MEIERKFLVRWFEFISSFDYIIDSRIVIEQFYIVDNDDMVVRARQISYGFSDPNDYYLTTKNKSTSGERVEIESKISSSDFGAYKEHFSTKTLTKTRWLIEYNKKKWEIDFISPDLVIAEIELEDINEEFELPDWVGLEITDCEEYYNNNLAK